MTDNDDKYVDMMHTLEPTLIYITTSETKTKEAINNHCTCKTCDSSCECTQKSGIRYSKEGLLTIINEKPAFECNFQCACFNEPTNCYNQVTSKGPHQNLNIKHTPNKNYGLFATGDIIKGSFICEYAGEVISEDEAKARSGIYKKRGICNYIFWLQEVNEGNDKKEVTIIDPTMVGNVGRYINHSCEPNCQLIPVRADNIHPKLCIFAERNILKDEEITFDYGSHYQGEIDVAGHSRVICKCTSLNCKGFLPFHGC